LAADKFPGDITNSNVCYYNEQPFFSLIVLMIVEDRKRTGVLRASGSEID
jgi:hypothetical protein